jgi:hypothetical protein
MFSNSGQSLTTGGHFFLPWSKKLKVTRKFRLTPSLPTLSAGWKVAGAPWKFHGFPLYWYECKKFSYIDHRISGFAALRNGDI